MPRALLVVGLGNGDEGKGSIVDHLVRRHGVRRVVRFNGGAQARHHVVNKGMVQGFSQFGAGTLAGAETVLSRFMLLEPFAFCREARELSELGVPDPFSLVTVSARAPIIPQANILANRILEAERGSQRHGSCGLGIGLTQGDVEEPGEQALYAGDLRNPETLKAKLALSRQRRLETVRHIDSEETRAWREQLSHLDLEDLTAFYLEFGAGLRIVPDEAILEILATKDTVFEGAQGVLLDQRWGFFPHVTRSTTTFENAETLLEEAGFQGDKARIGLLRGYGTRHGAGPFPAETDALPVAPCHNAANPWQGAFRIGWFDAVAARYALKAVGGVDILGLTNLDRLVGLGELKAAIRYQGEHFPEGKIPLVPPNWDALARRTDALLCAQPEYIRLSPIVGKSEQQFFHYADSLTELIGQEITLLSARPDQHKIYKRPPDV